MLNVDRLKLTYGRETILNGVSFQVQAGEVVGLIGANGAGKSSIIEIIAGVLRPTAGSVTLYDVPLQRRRDYQKMIGFVPQTIALTMHLTGRENVRQWGALKGLSGDALKREVERVGELCNLGDFWHKRITAQSGGMQRRINIAAGLIGSPRLLLLDEPTAGLDKESRAQILTAIENIKKTGVMVILSNHDDGEQAQVTDRQFLLQEGLLCDV